MTVTLLGAPWSPPKSALSPSAKGIFINGNQKMSSLASDPPRGSDFTQKNMKTLPAAHHRDPIHCSSLLFPDLLPHSFHSRLTSLFAVSHTHQACATPGPLHWLVLPTRMLFPILFLALHLEPFLEPFLDGLV